MLDLFNASPNPYVLVTPDLVIADANEAYLEATGSRREEILGRYIFDAFPSSPTESGAEAVRVVRESMLRAFQTRQQDVLALVRFDMAVPQPDGGVYYQERYWSATHTPILDEQGEAGFVLQHTVDITELHSLRRQARRHEETATAAMVEGDVLRRAEQVQATNIQLEADIRRLTDLFNRAPGFMALVRGPDHVFELANDTYVQLVGRSDLIGKPVRQALPEIQGQGYFELLDQVYASGEPAVRRAAPVGLRDPDGSLRQIYVDFVYQPVRSQDGDVIGIFVQGHDVTEEVEARERQDALIAELRAARDKLSRALSTGQVGVFEWQVDSDRLSVSGPIAQYFGVSPEAAEEGLPLAQFMDGIHDDDKERVAAAVERTVRTHETYEEEYRLLGKKGAIRWVLVRGYIQSESSQPSRFIGVLIDVTEQKQAEQAVREAEQRLRLALEASKMGDWSWDVRSDAVWLSTRAAEIFDVPPHETTWSRLQQLIHPDDHRAVVDKVETAARQGTSYATEYRVQHGSRLTERWISSRGRGSYDGQGQLIGMFGIVEDITARKKAEEAEKILIREIDHRAKNVMAVAQSVVKLTPFRNRKDYLEAVAGRIDALARAHSLLSGNRWLGASLAELVHQELAPYAVDLDRLVIEGPAIEIRAQGAQPLSLILHELATNAAKHGALSEPDGRVAVRWGRSLLGRLELEWQESCGKPVRKPRQSGFGSRLLVAAAQQLEAEIDQEWRKDGVRVRLGIDSKMVVPSLSKDMVRQRRDRQEARFDEPLRVLVVEDEALIAMAMERALISAGARVVGPVHALQEALAAAREVEFDVALVDMDLMGESAVPLIEVLKSQGKPFVIATGYEAPDLDHQYVLHKPISQAGLTAAVQEAVEASSNFSGEIDETL